MKVVIFQLGTISSQINNSGLVIVDYFEQDGKPETLRVSEFMDVASPKERAFLYEQLCLEADMWYGRNETSKAYFREHYPCDWLIESFQDIDLDQEIRGKFARMLAYIYIDDAPHTSPKMSRAFKAYETSNSIIGKVLLYSVSLYEVNN